MWFVYTWLRRTFGRCPPNRWRHEWEYDGSDRRTCLACGLRQKKVGELQLHGDADTIPQWATDKG